MEQLLIDQAIQIAHALDSDEASDAYFVARRAFYAASDAGEATDRDRRLWGVVMAVYAEAQARLAQQIRPLVVLR